MLNDTNPRKISISALAVSLALFALVGIFYLSSSVSNVQAQDTPNAVIEQFLKKELGKKDSKFKKKPVKQSLDDLFSSLKHETDGGKAQRIERIIWQRWANSGSETIDLLMSWAAIAAKEKNWGNAFDLLDQVIVLAPQYAEGWNRRATLHFLRSQYGRSLHDIEQVLKLEARHFGALAGLGNILQRLKKDRRALEIWKNILELYPANKNAQKSVVELEEKLAGTEI